MQTVVAPASAAPVSATSAETRQLGLLVLIAAGAVAFWFLPLGLDPKIQHAFAIAAFMIVGWMTNVIDHGLMGILGCALFWMTGVTRFETAFSGFAESTAWFLFGAICFGLMASKSGLARRLAYMVMRAVGHSYPRLLFGLILSDFLLTPVVPSGIARVVIMAAIATGLVEAFGVKKGSNIGRGMFVILVYSATIFDKMVIAGAASITARGAIEKFGEVDVLWSQWLLAYLPCDILVMIIGWRLTLWLFPPEPVALTDGPGFIDREIAAMGPWSAIEKRAALLMLGATALWITDFIHHIPAPMIGLGIGVVSFLPRVGVLTTDDVRKINYLPIFFVAAAASLSTVLAQTKALDLMTGVLFAWMAPFVTSIWGSTMVLYWTAFVYHILIGNEISMLATSLPVLMDFAKQHALDPLTLGMVWTFGAGPKLFIYESTVLVVGYSYGYFTPKDLFKIGAILSVVTAVILLLLVPLYWPLIGIGG